SPFYYDGYRPGIGWCALGPRELFVPAYNVNVSVTYVRNVNITNVNINQFNITNVNNTIVVNNNPHWGGQVSNFANHPFATVVPENAFADPRRTHDVPVRPSQTVDIARQPIARAPAVAAPRNAAVNASAGSPAPFGRERGGRPAIPSDRAGSTPNQPG